MKTQMIRQVKQSPDEAWFPQVFPEYNVGNQKLTLHWSLNTEHSLIYNNNFASQSCGEEEREKEKERESAVKLQVLLRCFQYMSWEILNSSYGAPIADHYSPLFPFFFFIRLSLGCQQLKSHPSQQNSDKSQKSLCTEKYWSQIVDVRSHTWVQLSVLLIWFIDTFVAAFGVIHNRTDFLKGVT